MYSKKERIKNWWENTKAWFARKYERIEVWCSENKGIFATMVLIFFSVLMEILKMNAKKGVNKDLFRSQMNTFYDDKTHMTYELKNHSKRRHNEMNLRVQEARDDGRDAASVLKEMKILK